MNFKQIESENEQKCFDNGSEKSENISHSHQRKQNINPLSFQLTFQVPDPSDPSQLQTKTLLIEKASDGIPKDSLIIYACSPSNQGRKVAVVPTDPLYVLNPIFPGDQKVYFFNGNVLNQNHSFRDYDISNGDRIVTVPVEQMNLNVEVFWRKATRNSSNDKERFTGIHDRQTQVLFAKNNDLVLFKAESRPASNRRLMKNLMFLINDKNYSVSKTNFSSFLPEKISEAPLPILW
jgi:hypothetical protein